MHPVAQNLGTHLGSTEPHHIRRWVNAQLAGQRQAIKCTAVAKATGARCCVPALRGASVCFWHRRGAVADQADAELSVRNRKVLASSSKGVARRRALKSMRRIARREVYRAWKLDPTSHPIDLLVLSPRDEERVAEWLRMNQGIDLNEPLPGTGAKATPRARDRLRQAAWRVLKRGEYVAPDFVRNAHLRVQAAVRDDAKFWAQYDAAHEERGW